MGLYYLQSRYYNPTIGRFLNADALVSTGQGVLGNNMFAYCRNNPIVLEDATGTADRACIYAESRIDDEPWRDHSPGGGGIPRRNYSSYSNYYGEVADKFYIVRLLRYLCNTDEQVVLNAQYFAFYKGQLVIREDWAFTNGRSGSFFIMFLNSNETDPDTVRHEWGHFVQLRMMGLPEYIVCVAIPSVLSGGNPDYYSLPWERTADFFGGVNRASGYKSGALAWGISQFFLGVDSVYLYLLFG